MQEAQNSPPSGASRRWATGGPVGYKPGMRGGMCDGAREGMWQGTHNSPLGSGNRGTQGLGQ